MKKKFVLGMALAMTVILAGCSDGGSAEGSQAQGSEISESVETAGSEGASESSQGGESGAGKEAAGKNAESGPEGTQQEGTASAGGNADMGVDESWKALYADFLEKNIDALVGEYEPDWREGWSFGFIYLNNDPTPELVVSSGYEAAGNIICTPVDGKVEYLQTARLNFFYKEFGGLLDNSDGNMGYYYDYIYRLGDKGFELVHEGNHNEEYDDEGNITAFHYDMDGRDVTKKEYDQTIEELLPAMQRLFWANGCSYDDMMNYLKGNTAKDYREAYRKVIKDGVKGINGDLDRFALIERTNSDPLLLCAGDQEYCFCSFDDGLLQVGPTTYFSETEFVLVYPGLGLIENTQYYENNEMSCARYYMKEGSLISNYINAEAKYDSDWNPVLDTAGNPIVTYKINSAEVAKEQFDKQLSRYDEIFKQQLVSPKEDYTFIEYSTAIQMYDKLSE